MRWTEKNFATLEMFYDMWQEYDTIHCAISPQPFWPTYVQRPFSRKDPDAALHSPFPIPLSNDFYVFNNEYAMGRLRMLLHFCDFLFPLFGATGSGLDRVSSQIPAIYRVNHFLKTR